VSQISLLQLLLEKLPLTPQIFSRLREFQLKPLNF
jgi:hypothetical protein